MRLSTTSQSATGNNARSTGPLLAPAIPANALTLSGQPLTIAGQNITLG